MLRRVHIHSTGHRLLHAARRWQARRLNPHSCTILYNTGFPDPRHTRVRSHTRNPAGRPCLFIKHQSRIAFDFFFPYFRFGRVRSTDRQPASWDWERGRSDKADRQMDK
jgi:hypothetical protein